MKDSTIRKPSFLKLAIGLLLYSSGLNRNKARFISLKKIEEYKLIKKINKENKFEDSFVGCYSKDGKKFFIKTFHSSKKDFRNYFVLSEWLISNFLYKRLFSQNTRITTPKPIELITSNNHISLVYEYIDGRNLSLFPLGDQIKVFTKVTGELKKISRFINKDLKKEIPKRSTIFYIFSLPYLSLITFLNTDGKVNLIIKSLILTLKMLIFQKPNPKLILAHRDLKPHNIIVKNSKIFLVDTGRMALTLPGYDLAVLSLDPKYKKLSESLEKKFKTPTSKSLKSYIAIQFAGNSQIGGKYLSYLHKEYAK